MKTSFILLFILSLSFFDVFAQSNHRILIDRDGNTLNPYGDYTDESFDGIALYREEGKYGFKNGAGQEKLEARYDLAQNLGKGFVAFAYSAAAEAWYIFDHNGKMVHGSPFKQIHSLNGTQDDKPTFLNGLLMVQSISISKFGCLDTTGKMVIPEIYDYIKDLGDPVLYIGKDGLHGLMNKKSKEEILTKYDKINEFSQGLAAVSKKGKWGYINYEGKEIIGAKFKVADYFFNDQAAVALDDKTSGHKLINLKGDIINGLRKEQVKSVYENILIVINESKKTAIYNRLTGKALTDYKYINEPHFANDFAVGQEDLKTATLINKKGEVIIKGYDGYGTVSEGLVCVYNNEVFENAPGKKTTLPKSGFMDIEGNPAIPLEYGGVSTFINGIAEVTRFEDYKAEVLQKK